MSLHELLFLKKAEDIRKAISYLTTWKVENEDDEEVLSSYFGLHFLAYYRKVPCDITKESRKKYF